MQHKRWRRRNTKARQCYKTCRVNAAKHTVKSKAAEKKVKLKQANIQMHDEATFNSLFATIVDTRF